ASKQQPAYPEEAHPPSDDDAPELILNQLTQEPFDVYGKYELQTLEDVLRDSTKWSNYKEIEQIVRTITRRIRYEDTVKPGREWHFLNEFYRAQREHLESL
ncbi:hypothetical protein ACC676_38315, partial [Rhizobium ruizarguesonis]